MCQSNLKKAFVITKNMVRNRQKQWYYKETESAPVGQLGVGLDTTTDAIRSDRNGIGIEKNALKTYQPSIIT